MLDKEGLILKVIPYSDSSKICSIFTTNGIESVMVKGARNKKSKYQAIAQPLNHLTYSTTSAKFPILKDAELLHFYDAIKQDVESYAYASLLLELIYKLGMEQNHETVFSFLLELLIKLPTNPEFYGMLFELKYLYLLGLQPVFKHCVECGSEERVGFDAYSGGMVCSNHIKNTTVTDQEVIVALYHMYYHKLEEVPFEIPQTQVRLILDSYYEHFLNFTAKSRKIIKDLYHY